MRPIFGFLASLVAAGLAAYSIFYTEFGTRFGAVVGLGLLPLGRFESFTLQTAGVRATLAGVILLDAIVICVLAIVSILNSFRDFEDILYKTIINGGVALVAAGSFWVWVQAAHGGG